MTVSRITQPLRRRLFVSAVSALALIGIAVAPSAAEPVASPQQAIPGPQVAPAASPLAHAIRTALEQPELRAALKHRWVDAAMLSKFYESTGYAPIWTGSDAADRKTADVLAVMREGEQHGLDLSAYDFPALVARQGAAAVEDRAVFEVMMSAAYVAYYGDLGEGQVDPRDLYAKQYGYAPHVDPAGVLQAAAASDAAEWLRMQVPDNRLYAGLVQALRTYRMLQAEGGWPTLPEGPKLEPGQRHEQVPLLRARLLASGDLVPDGAVTAVSYDAEIDALRYDETLAQAVRAFQLRHGLLDDGVLGPRTRAALNVPVAERLEQILINLERLRWMPGHLGGRYILANTAGYSVEVIENERTVLSMAAIVGEDENQTPVFSHTMTFLEFNPYWNIPPSIAQKEIAAKVRSDWSYLSNSGIRVLDGYDEGAHEYDPAAIDWSNMGENSPYRLRQDPGPRNPLGDVKFMFPNQYAIYLHDTPGDQLFDRTQRAFSHGCIRLSKPLELAAYLLRGQDGWTEETIAAVMAGNERQVVDLARSIPVHLTYLTAWVDEDGRMQFRDDVYDRDGKLKEALGTAERVRSSDLSTL